ncbi:hypothetical protein BC751_2994 [Cecembia calidifontis]|jgi:hypothetical protein|uniref:Uncharacterized protein n=1 Tax=Cecembia calidifontis TaxID=1187080 RepID=A0A4Q7PCF6_9BACT|nr:hypothetical protein BC751_2994 [Cecembia calidifontis]
MRFLIILIFIDIGYSWILIKNRGKLYENSVSRMIADNHKNLSINTKIKKYGEHKNYGQFKWPIEN